MDRPMLSSPHGSGLSSDYSTSMIMRQRQQPYHMQDSTQMVTPVLSQDLLQNPESWPPNTIMPSLDTSISMMEEIDLSQNARPTHSPVTQDEYSPRCTSVASNPGIAERQEKVRVEVSFF